MHSIHATVEHVYIWRMRARKNVVRLLQQRQHALSAVGTSLAMYTDIAFCNQFCFTPGETPGHGALCLPAVLVPLFAESQRSCPITQHDVYRHPQANV